MLNEDGSTIMSGGSDRFQVVVLCEDRNHYHFVRGFVGKRHPNASFVPRLSAPGIGSGRAFVESRFRKEVQETKKRLAKARTRLVVVIDGDNDAVPDVIRRLDLVSYLGATKEEHVVVAIPRRNIETWMSFAAGEAVDESTDYKSHRGTNVTAKKAGEEFATRIGRDRLDCETLPALLSAYERYAEVFKTA